MMWLRIIVTKFDMQSGIPQHVERLKVFASGVAGNGNGLRNDALKRRVVESQ